MRNCLCVYSRFGLDDIGEVSEDERNGSPSNEADTLTQSMPQAVKHGMNYYGQSSS